MTKIIVVMNRHIIAKNRKHGTTDDPIRVSKGRYGKPTYCSRYDISGGILIYDPDHPLPCGATAWIEI